ncbi:MAG TPA: SCO family protein [Bacilli bacterium]
MRNNWRQTIAITTILLFGFALFYASTDGFHAYTTKSAVQYELLHSRPHLPAVTLQDGKGREFRLDRFAKGKYVLLSFMYTTCKDVCPAIELNMAKIYRSVPKHYLGKEIEFLSVSFDPARDTPSVLAKYGSAFGSDGETWRMARINDAAELKRVLDQYGVTVIPDGNGEFTHSTSFYLIGKDGRLLQAMNYTKVEETLDAVMNALRGSGG